MTYPTTTPDGLTVRDPELPPFTGCHHDYPNDTTDATVCPFAPLERLAELAARAGSPFHPHAFMHMGDFPGRDGSTIHAYKHSDTRRYIHVDDAGHTYRSTWPAGPEPRGVVFVAYASPADAINHAYT